MPMFDEFDAEGNRTVAGKIKTTLKAAYGLTYPADGENFRTCSNFARRARERYWSNPITQLSIWLGLPNRQLYRDEDATWKNLFHNFIGWQANTSTSRKIINAGLMPITIALNVLAMPFRMATNVLKLATEFLPLLLIDGIDALNDHFLNWVLDKVDTMNAPIKIAAFAIVATMVRMILGTLGICANFIYWTGRTITSPFENIRSAWRAIHKQFGEGIVSDFLGYALASFIILFTIGAYTVMFHLAANFMASKVLPQVAPFLATHLPKVCDLILQVSQAVLPLLNRIGAIWSPGSVMPFIDGLAVIAGIGLPTIGNGLNKLVDNMTKWLHKPVARAVPQPPRLLKHETSIGEPNKEEKKPCVAAGSDARMRTVLNPLLVDVKDTTTPLPTVSEKEAAPAAAPGKKSDSASQFFVVPTTTMPAPAADNKEPEQQPLPRTNSQC